MISATVGVSSLVPAPHQGDRTVAVDIPGDYWDETVIPDDHPEE